jgi:hypothetical protein
MLFSKPTSFLGVQALVALGFALAGSTSAWEQGANWWPLTVALADLICLFLLAAAFRAEGKRYRDLFRIERRNIGGDLLALVGVTVLTAPVSYLPNVWLGRLLFGAPEATLDLIVRPLPLWAVYAAIVSFPILQGLTELPIYYGYVMPRLEAQGLSKWLALSIPSLVLAFQHAAAPLLFDLRFFTWRALMFIPFAFLAGIVLHWRPRLMPYLVVIHVLMNMSFVAMFLGAAY